MTKRSRITGYTASTDPTTTEALHRARVADLTVTRPARRTLAEMAPGYTRQPLLRLVPPKAAAERCIFCEQWSCPGNCQQYAPAPTASLVKAVAL